MENNWDNFLNLSEEDQARFLLDVASIAWEKQKGLGGIKAKIESNIKLGHEVLAGNFTKLSLLIRFLDDPDMKDDFGSFFEQLKDNQSAAAALDLASYACGFVCRVMAPQAKITVLPDPVLEALPDIYEYYRDRAQFLGIYLPH